MINESDELLHEVGSDPAWQESFCFNWADPEHKSFSDEFVALVQPWFDSTEPQRIYLERMEPDEQ